MSYTIIKTLAVCILVSYFAFGMYTLEGKEIYPVFSWQLFSYIPNEGSDYSMEIYQYGDEIYEPPLHFSQMKFLFEKIQSSPTEYTPIIRDLGKALENDQYQEATELRAKVEKMFQEQSFSYSILKVRYDPVKYWKTRIFDEKTILSTYQKL